jgi:hypothetical protein
VFCPTLHCTVFESWPPVAHVIDLDRATADLTGFRALRAPGRCTTSVNFCCLSILQFPWSVSRESQSLEVYHIIGQSRLTYILQYRAARLSSRLSS